MPSGSSALPASGAGHVAPEAPVAHGAAPTDLFTVVAVSALAFIVSNVLHEGLGHGGTCLLVGGKPLSLTAVYFENDPAGLSDGQSRLIAAGGPLVNLLTGIFGLLALRRLGGRPGPGHYCLWLVATLGLFMATGYLLFSGVGGIGDLAVVTGGLEPDWAWRVALALSGGVLYYLSAVVMAGEFARFAGAPTNELRARARRLALVSYATGAAVVCAAGALNPKGFVFVLISAAAATLGGASGLLWMMRLPQISRVDRPCRQELALPRSWGWILVAAVVVAGYVVVLGPGIRL